MEETKKCPKCEGEMEKGLVPDINNPGGYKKHIWGKDSSRSFNLKVESSKEIITYCCKSCGYLESYAW